MQSLIRASDQELIHLFQRHREKGQYFTLIFCRYSHSVYSLINRFVHWQSLTADNWSTSHRRLSPVQVEYLFAKTWQYIFHQLRHLNLAVNSIPDAENLSLQGWVLSTTATYLNQTEIPPVETIHYSLSAASPPLWCYLQEALDRLPAILRLMLIMAQTFHWSETRIAAYLQAEGEAISPAEVQARLQEGYQLLETLLPEDIQAIYLGSAVPEVCLELD